MPVRYARPDSPLLLTTGKEVEEFLPTSGIIPTADLLREIEDRDSFLSLEPLPHPYVSVPPPQGISMQRALKGERGFIVPQGPAQTRHRWVRNIWVAGLRIVRDVPDAASDMLRREMLYEFQVNQDGLALRKNFGSSVKEKLKVTVREDCILVEDPITGMLRAIREELRKRIRREDFTLVDSPLSTSETRYEAEEISLHESTKYPFPDFWTRSVLMGRKTWNATGHPNFHKKCYVDQRTGNHFHWGPMHIPSQT